MKFESFSGSRRSRRQNCPVPAPVMVETMETRALLAAPQILSPTGTISDSTPTITWEAVNNATSYDLWVTDVETRQRLVYETGLTATNFTPSAELNVGRLRIWAKANFADSSTTGWGAPTDVVLQVAPVITGPVNASEPLTPTKINSSTTPITWTSPPGARSFEIFLSNQTAQTSQSIRVANLVPVGDANGNPIPDGNGDVLRQEVRQYFLSGEVAIVGAAPQAISGASNTTDIVITSTAHGLKTGEKVRITGVEGNTAANGTFYVTVLTANTFQLTGVTGNASYTQGGSFTKLTELRSELPMGQYRAFIRTTDDAGRVSDWSAAYNFEVATSVQITRPTGPTFQSPITLEWKPVDGATHYEVFVSRPGANESTPVYNVKYLKTTSYTLPANLATGDYVFWVRARRLSQTSEIALSGTPASGTFTITLRTTGVGGKTQTTSALPFNATEAQVRSAIRALDGFEAADVKTGRTAPNLTHIVVLPQMSGPVTVTVASAISPGRIAVTTRNSPEVVGLWSARTTFSTIKTPVITGPVGVQTNDPNVQTVTSVRPTIEWTAIDKAARYEVWVDRTASATTYLRTNAPTNSYTFDSDIQPGNYWVWVRAVSTTGEMTAWSTPYKFTATGGAPVITFPLNATGANSLPTIQWTTVPQAATYEIQIAWVGVDFNYITETGLTSTNFTPFAPLNTGSYRVWVRAIAADGTAMRWSNPVTFLVDANSPATGLDAQFEVLTALLEPAVNPSSETTHAEAVNVQSVPVDAPPQAEPAIVESEVTLPPATEADEFLHPELIEQLAEKLAASEWWMMEDEAVNGRKA